MTRISEGLFFASGINSQLTQISDNMKMVPDRSFTQISADSSMKKLLISDSLNGKTITYYSYTNKENKFEVQKAESDFGYLAISPNNEDIYDALESSFSGIIDNYKTSNGEILKAEEVTWITNLPNVLFFQIQRVQYNVKDSFLNRMP